ncbi:MAG: hypothetical protein FI687_02945 [SAR202 cluster bacterium]|nr:hypothetical protein [SAR202 cluster bacterium]|tara:strand:+ start:10280 stop:11689 length:1410 start_codon:yes stop_codon:yes gene_type:complete
MRHKNIDSINVSNNRQLFVDDYLIDSNQDIDFKLHNLIPRETALDLSSPWEGVTCDYHKVFKDGEKFRMYYRGTSHSGYTINSMLSLNEKVVKSHAEVICYAESDDGVNWIKPSLGLFEFAGSKNNNIVWMSEFETHDLVPFKDENPICKEEERYKGIVWVKNFIYALKSPDGLKWSFMRDEPILTDGPFDSQNVPMWDPFRSCYVIFTRGKIGQGGSFGGGYRWIRTATSENFLDWSDLIPIETTGSSLEHLYTNGVVSYERSPGLYLGFPRRFSPARLPFKDSTWPGTSDSVFMSSRDGIHWDRRFMESFIRPGLDERNWTSRNNLLSCGILQTSNTELSMYILRHRDFPSCRFDRATIRLDGFVSINGGYGGGEISTKLLHFSGQNLYLNYSTSAAGFIKIELQSPNGKYIEGYSIADSPEIFGDHCEGLIRWKNGANLPVEAVQSGLVKLRFILKDADIYSFKFA